MSEQATLFRHAPPRYRLALERERDSRDWLAEPAPDLQDYAFTRPKAVVEYLWRTYYGTAAQEVMVWLAVDRGQRLIGSGEAYRGTLGRAAAEPRGILVPALLLNAGGVIVAHNHPSGNPSPSSEDLAFTRRLAEAGELVGVPLVDHLIIGDRGRWLSLQEHGL